MPDAEEKAILIDFVRRNFGSYTLEQVKEAFEMAIMGKLDCNDAKCFENFSCEFVGRILSSYERFLKAAGILKTGFELERTYQEPKALIEAPKKTNAEIIDIARGLWQAMRKVDFVFPPAYQALVDEKLIPHPLPKDLQQLYWHHAELRVKELEKNGQRFAEPENRIEWKKRYARQLVVAEFFISEENGKAE